MSKLLKIAIECPKCSHQYMGDFFRTIWGENEAEPMSLIYSLFRGFFHVESQE